jgi:hypothetical protein
MALISGPVIGAAYCRAATRDERNGYVITAALEWRTAAELMLPISSAADHCWRQWERIMHLPRRLAEPIGGDGGDVFTPSYSPHELSKANKAR